MQLWEFKDGGLKTEFERALCIRSLRNYRNTQVSTPKRRSECGARGEAFYFLLLGDAKAIDK